jgi:hypothetical protein
MNMKWDGETLDNNQGTQITIATHSHNDTTIPMELFDVLNALKWFEFHFVFGKNLVESDIFAFDFVDQEEATTKKFDL